MLQAKLALLGGQADGLDMRLNTHGCITALRGRPEVGRSVQRLAASPMHSVVHQLEEGQAVFEEYLIDAVRGTSESSTLRSVLPSMLGGCNQCLTGCS